MDSQSKRFRVFLTLALIFTLSPAAFADTVKLKDGSVIKGRIVSFGGGTFVVAVGSGTRRKEMSFAAGEVESIQFDQNPGSQTASKSSSQPISNASYNPAPATVEPKSAANENNSPTSAQAEDTADAKPVLRTETAEKPKVPDASTTGRSSAGIRPIEISVNVLADNTSNGWTNSGFVVKKGQKIKISGGGVISLGGGKTTGPSGSYELEDASKLLKSVPTGALIAVIGDDNNDFIYIGSGREITAARDGSLFLGVNEGNLSDNSGKFTIKIEIDPISGS